MRYKMITKIKIINTSITSHRINLCGDNAYDLPSETLKYAVPYY